jgi:radical SAM superfamily enzyme YgiQ (UPF0313 family)
MFAEDDDPFLAALRQEQPRVVGLSALATMRVAALRMATYAKRAGATVVAGGADPTARPHLYLQHSVTDIHPFDVVVIGEAEETILELLPLLLQEGPAPEALMSVQGIAYRDNTGEVVTTSPRPLIHDVDSIPLPARDLIDVELYRQAWHSRHGSFSLSILATRGCPFNCAWCQKTVFGRSFRPRSPQLVAEEMRVLKTQYHPDQLRIVDDVMGIDRDWVRQWHDAVLETDACIPFECLSRVDLMDEELARLLRDVGCVRISFGTESGSQSVLDAMTKGITVEQIYRAAEVCRQFGIETYFYMMVGYPGEVWGDLQESVRLLRDTTPDAFSTTIAYPLPGTAFFEQLCEQFPDEKRPTLDWEHTAENRLLFERGQYGTFFYRRVIRWFHSEWKDACIEAGAAVTRSEWMRRKAALWRDRLLVNVLSRLPGLTWTGFRNQKGR